MHQLWTLQMAPICGDRMLTSLLLMLIFLWAELCEARQLVGDTRDHRYILLHWWMLLPPVKTYVSSNTQTTINNMIIETTAFRPTQADV